MTRLSMLGLSLILASVTFLTFGIGAAAQDDTDPPLITPIGPTDGEIIRTRTPTIAAEYSDPSGIDVSSAMIVVDRIDVTEFQETTITEHGIEYVVPEMLQLRDGNHTVTVIVSDNHGNEATLQWRFTVDLTVPPKEFDLALLIRWIAIGTAAAIGAFGAFVLYLRIKRNFTFKKHFTKHPEQRTYLVIFIPMIIGFIFVIVGLTYVTSVSGLSPFAPEYVIVIGLYVSLLPYAALARRERGMKEKYERAFSQFLFEMAEAMRGGLHPSKAITELATTDTGIMKKHLKVAADNIKLGRPFEEVILNLVKPMKSSLATRYASLIGEAASVGGQTSVVIHRAAKDMDDFMKVNADRRRQLTMQVTTIYIAFGVLIIILYQLISIYPSLADMDISLLGATTLEEASGGGIVRMSFITLKRRFLHLMLFNSFGAGILIGQFVDGKPRHGLMHSLVMVGAATLFFDLMIL